MDGVSAIGEGLGRGGLVRFLTIVGFLARVVFGRVFFIGGLGRLVIGVWSGGTNCLRAAEPIREIEIEVAITVSGTGIALAVTGGKSGGVGLIRGVAIEGGRSTILD